MLPFSVEMPPNKIKRIYVKQYFSPTPWSLSVYLLFSPMDITRAEFLDVRNSREGAYRQSALSSGLSSQDQHFLATLLKIKPKIPGRISR